MTELEGRLLRAREELRLAKVAYAQARAELRTALAELRAVVRGS